MTFTKTAMLPVAPDEAFALITQPERLRRWQTVSAFVDLRAGGEYRWTVTPGHVAAGTFREVEPGRRIVFGWGWDGNADLAAGRVDGDGHRRARRRRLARDAGPRGSHRASRPRCTPRAGTTTSSGSSAWPPPVTPVRTSGPGAPRSSTRSRRPRPALAVAPADAAQPDRRGPAEADPVHRLHLPRARRAPVRLAGPARRDGRSDGEEPRGGFAGEPGLGDGRSGHRGVARRRPRRHRPRPWRRRDAGVVRPPASSRSSWPCTAGTSPRPAASSCTSPTSSSPTCAAWPSRSYPAVDGGSFADEVAPAEDAAPIDRLAAFAGRRPAAA